MRYAQRALEPQIARAAHGFGAVVLTGPRRAGKTFLLRHLLPKADYVLLEDPDTLARVRSDPRSFVAERRPPVILDEVQNAPELFNYVRAVLDRHPRRVGQWFLTGSQEASLMGGVTESLAGRAAIFQLLPLSLAESAKVDLLHGGFPEVLARPRQRHVWFSSYLQSYLERDVRAVTGVRDLSTFRRFLGLVAARHGQILNRSDLAGPLGVSVPTVSAWLSVLEVTGQVLIVPPYFENFGKRLIKSPKIYWVDSGLACHLLGIHTKAELARSPFRGALFEGMVAGEIVKAQLNAGGRKEIYFFRDRPGLEVDFLIPRADGLWLVEAKASATALPGDARAMQSLAAGRRGATRARGFVVHQHTPHRSPTSVLVPGVQALTLGQFVDELGATH